MVFKADAFDLVTFTAFAARRWWLSIFPYFLSLSVWFDREYLFLSLLLALERACQS